MIVGNRNAGRKFLTVCLAVLLMMIIIAVLVGFRKKMAPANEPPLHPSSIVGILASAGNPWDYRLVELLGATFQS